MKIGYDAKRYFHNHTGLGNYSRSIVQGIQKEYPADDCLLYDLKALPRTLSMGRRAKAEGCDLLHGLSNELPLVTPLPTIVTMHDVAWRTFPDMYHWADRHIYDLKYGHSCRKATRVLAISESTKRDVMRFYGVDEGRIDVIYQPVLPLFYEPMSADEAAALVPTKEEYILNVGSINSRKNLLGLVKALELLPRDQRPLLLVVGNGREYKRLVMAYVVQHGLSPWVQLLDEVRDNRMLQALYTRAKLMAYPSHYEGFGLPVVEAALQRCPVVTSTVSSLPEAAGPGALLADPTDIGAISHAIGQLLDHPDLARQMGEQAEAYARRSFDRTTLTHQLHQLYERVAATDK